MSAEGVARTRGRVLSLYRDILRTGRSWRGGPEEQHYIRREAQKAFRENAAESSAERIEELATEAETRLEYAVHYGIPYPRLHHAPQFPKRYVMDAPQMPEGPQHASGSTEVSDKLAAAEARRRAKQEQARHESNHSS